MESLENALIIEGQSTSLRDAASSKNLGGQEQYGRQNLPPLPGPNRVNWSVKNGGEGPAPPLRHPCYLFVPQKSRFHEQYTIASADCV